MPGERVRRYLIEECMRMINYRVITDHLTDRQKSIIKNCLNRIVTIWPSTASLVVLAIKHGTDKLTHGYIPRYEKYFSSVRLKKVNILEIGVGGYKDPKAGGESLRMWKEYFPNGIIYAVDIYDKRPHAEERIRIFQGSQNDPEFLKAVVQKAGSFDIIIDDGSHVNEHVITSFGTLFPLLANNGIYVIEDLQTSYNPKYGGSSEELDHSRTSIGMLKKLIDGLNYQYIEGRAPTYLDQNITAIHLYPKMAFVFKGRNGKDPRALASHSYLSDQQRVSGRIKTSQ
jgi:hypothetical protein